MCILCFLFDRYKRRKIISNHWSFTQVSQLQFDLECTANGYMQKVIRGRTKPPPPQDHWQNQMPPTLTWTFNWSITVNYDVLTKHFYCNHHFSSLYSTTGPDDSPVKVNYSGNATWPIKSVCCFRHCDLCQAETRRRDETRRDETRDSSQRE